MIAKKSEPVESVGILLKGQVLLSVQTDKIGVLETGTVIGYMAGLQSKPVLNHNFDITALNDGILSVFYIRDLQELPKKSPKLAFKLVEFFANQASSIIFSQFLGGNIFLYNTIEFIEYSTRRKQEFLMMHPLLGFHSNLTRIDIKILACVFKVVHPKENFMITRINCIENSVFFVVEGNIEIFELKLIEDSIFGIPYFLRPGTP